MSGLRTRASGSLLALALALGLASGAGAQSPRAGVVTNLEGTATVARAAAPRAALRLKDDVFQRDRIATGDESRARLLLGGKALVTIRERSVFTIHEAPGVSTIDITSGKLSLAVVHDRMKPGERIEVRTPNAVTAVRGTIVVTEVSGTPPAVVSRFTLLQGLVDVSLLDPATGRPVGAPVGLSALQRTTVTGFTPPTAPQAISRAEGDRIAAQYTFGLPQPSASRDVVDQQVQQAADAAAGLGFVLPGAADETSGPRLSGDALRSRSGGNVVPPPVAPAPPTPLPTRISPNDRGSFR